MRWAVRLDGVVRVDLRLEEEAPASVASLLLVASVIEGMLSGEGIASGVWQEVSVGDYARDVWAVV